MVNSTQVMSFVAIAEAYPDEYVLVKVDEIDHVKGKETGFVLCVSESRDELVTYSQSEGIVNDTVIVSGENLTPVLGGLLL